MSNSIRKYEQAQTSHHHDDFHQVIIPILGDLELDVDGVQGRVGGRTLGVITQGERHAFRARGDNRFMVLDIAKQDCVNDWSTIWSYASDKPFVPLSNALLSLSDYALFCSDQAPDDTCLDLWQNLFMQTLACELNKELPDLPKRIQGAVSYIEANFARRIDNQELADHVALSPSRFYELFRTSLGMSPQQYLQACRLNMAKRLIKRGANLADVAQDVGFSDQSSFGKAFVKAFGLSPAKWRQSEFPTKKS